MIRRAKALRRKVALMLTTGNVSNLLVLRGKEDVSFVGRAEVGDCKVEDVDNMPLAHMMYSGTECKCCLVSDLRWLQVQLLRKVQRVL